jgi:thiol-disulfide isomerase/thioredoxin
MFSHALRLLPLLCLFFVAAAHAQQVQPAVGDRIPAFDTELLDGRTLADKALAKRPVLVVVWASWCPTCRKELPELQKLYDKHKAAGFEILALSIDAGRIEAEDYWQEHRYSFPVAMRSPRHVEIFGGQRTPPRFFLIGRDGRLAFRHVGAIGYDKLEAALKPLL